MLLNIKIKRIKSNTRDTRGIKKPLAALQLKLEKFTTKHSRAQLSSASERQASLKATRATKRDSDLRACPKVRSVIFSRAQVAHAEREVIRFPMIPRRKRSQSPSRSREPRRKSIALFIRTRDAARIVPRASVMAVNARRPSPAWEMGFSGAAWRGRGIAFRRAILPPFPNFRICRARYVFPIRNNARARARAGYPRENSENTPAV